ncbi:glycosyltransferase [Myroides odoratus]|uniref:glycosyltransferase n=1 Tax=Myroides odoratus TaxID=256 RepID=UPI0039AF2FD5
MSQKKIKIALLGDTLANGGAERIHSTLSLYFEATGFEVYNLINLDVITYPYGGVLYNLGVFKSPHFSIGNKFKRFQLFRKYMQVNAFDYVIDFRTRTKPLTEILLQHLVFDKGYIPTIHSSNLPWYFTKSTYIGKHLYRKAHSIVSVSQAITDQVKAVYHYKNVETLYNPIDLEEIQQQASLENPFAQHQYIVACGRMDSTIKQFDRLIETYAQSQLPQANIHLVILGDGKYKVQLEKQIKELQLEKKVHLPGFLSPPFAIFKGALFFVHSSRLEGFPTVLLEAFACEIPVIAFDCPTGPSEIIQSNYNGLLIENQNFEELKIAMEYLAFDVEKRQRLQSNTLATALSFDIASIGKKWLDLLC